MSPLLRGGLAVVGLAGAFAAGFFLKHLPSAAQAGDPAAVAAAPTGKPVSAPRSADKPMTARTVTAIVPPVMPKAAVTVQLPDARIIAPPLSPPAPTAVLAPPTAVPDAIDPLDPGYQMIKNALGIKTTIIDKVEPPPVVLTEGRTVPPVAADAPRIDLPVVEPPPMPRAEPAPPPPPGMPPIDVAPSLPDPAPMPPDQSRDVARGLKPDKLVSTRDVAFDFELTKIGPSSMTAVELWTTRDRGATWSRTDRMAGCMPPFRTRLGSDGRYGFRLVCESESGMRTPDPRPGQSPDIGLILDSTPPKVSHLSLSSVDGQRDRVRIRWEMSDDHLDAEYVRIEYSTDGQAWNPIPLDPRWPHDSKVGHSRVWTVPPGLPHRVMIRVTARDLAGNETTAALPDRVSIDLVAPEGKLTGLRTVGAEMGPMPREVGAVLESGRPLPAVLRTLLPALLASPSLFPPFEQGLWPVVQQPLAWNVSGGNDDRPLLPPFIEFNEGSGWYIGSIILLPGSKQQRSAPWVEVRSAREWVEAVTRLSDFDERRELTYRRPDPFAVPIVGSELTPTTDAQELAPLESWISWRGADLEQQWRQYHRPLVRAWGRLTGEESQPFRQSAGYSAGRSLIHMLADRDWKPSTASPESHRTWHADRPAPRSIFDGMIDVVVPSDVRPEARVAQSGR